MVVKSPLGTFDDIPPPIRYLIVNVVCAGVSPRVFELSLKFNGSTKVSMSLSSPGMVIPTWSNCMKADSSICPLLKTPLPKTNEVVSSSFISVMNLFDDFSYCSEYGTGTDPVLKNQPHTNYYHLNPHNLLPPPH